MSWTLRPLSERVTRMRADYRDLAPTICTARYRILTEFYMNHPELNGILRRAKVMKEIFEKLPIRIGEEEVIVGNQSSMWRAALSILKTVFLSSRMRLLPVLSVPVKLIPIRFPMRT